MRKPDHPPYIHIIKLHVSEWWMTFGQSQKLNTARDSKLGDIPVKDVY